MGLAAGQSPAVFAHRRPQAFGKATKHPTQTGHLRGIANLALVRLGSPQRDVVAERAGEQVRSLAKPGDRGSRKAGRGHAVQQPAAS
jgi:hypothetical protein